MKFEYTPLFQVEEKKTLFVITSVLLVMIYVSMDLSSLSDWNVGGYIVRPDDAEASVLGETGRNEASSGNSEGAFIDKVYTVEINSENGTDKTETKAVVENDGMAEPDSGTKNRTVGDDEIKTDASSDYTYSTKHESNIDSTDPRKTKANDKTDTIKYEVKSDNVRVTDTKSIDENNGITINTNINRTGSVKTDVNGIGAVNKTFQSASQTDKTLNSSFYAALDSIRRSPHNIFFVESRCVTEKSKKYNEKSGSFVLNARQCCAVESTARANPERPVYVFHSCGLSDDFVSTSAPYVGRLVSYKNVLVVRLVAKEVFRGTPVQRLYESGALEESAYPVEHTSDLVRLALLWKFGGTYCDLDVVTIKPLSTLGSNWAGMQDMYTVANGVLDVAPEGEAHQMMGEALTRVNDHYNPSGWSSNGPELLTEFLLRHCAANTVADAMGQCRMEFTIYPSPVLYPLYYTQFSDFFDERIGPNLVTSLKRTAFSVHLWNKMSHDSVATVGSQQAYSLLAKEFCPAVYASCGDRF